MTCASRYGILPRDIWGTIFLKRWYEDSVGLHLTRAARLHRARAQTMLRDMNLHAGQETMLQVLLDGDGQSMSHLARELRVKPPTLTKMVARMAAQGLLRRAASATDGRSAVVFLTDEGRAQAVELKERWKTLERETLGELGDKDRKRLLKLLMAIEASLGDPGLKTAGKSRPPGAEDAPDDE